MTQPAGRRKAEGVSFHSIGGLKVKKTLWLIFVILFIAACGGGGGGENSGSSSSGGVSSGNTSSSSSESTSSGSTNSGSSSSGSVSSASTSSGSTSSGSSSSGSTSSGSTSSGGGLPAISSFTPSSASILLGDRVVLNWNVSAATRISIDQGVGVVTGSAITVQPRATTTYTLTATNSYGTRTSQVQVSVNTTNQVRWVGKSGQPYITIQAAIDAAKAGDVIRIQPGTYSEALVIRTPKLTLEAADLNQPPEIDGADQEFHPTWSLVSGKTYRTPYVWPRAQVDDVAFTSYGGGIDAAPFQLYEDGALLRGYRNRHESPHSNENIGLGGAYSNIKELDPTYYNDGVLPENNKRPSTQGIPGRFMYDPVNHYVYVWGSKGDNPSGHSYAIPVHFHLLQAKATGLILRGLVFKHSLGFAVVLDGANDSIIENCYFVANHNSIYIPASSGVIIRNNFIQELGYYERYAYDDVKNTLMHEGAIRIDGFSSSKNIDIYRNTIHGFNMAIEAHGLNLSIHDNIVSYGTSLLINATEYHQPVDVDYNLKIYRNVFHHVDDSAIGISLMHNGSGGPGWIYRNVFYACYSMVKDGQNVDLYARPKKFYFYHNTIALQKQWNNDPYLYPPYKKVVFRNNLVLSRFKSYEVYWRYGSKDVAKGWNYLPFSNGPDSDYNLFYEKAAAMTTDGIADFGSTSFDKGDVGTQFRTMQSQTGLELHSLQADPLFVNSSALFNADVFTFSVDALSKMNYKNVIKDGYSRLFDASIKYQYEYFDVKDLSPAKNRGGDYILTNNLPDIASVSDGKPIVSDGKPDIGAFEAGRRSF